MFHYLQSKESGHVNTHTQFTLRGWVAAVSKVTATMAIVVFALSPLALTSCSSLTEPDATLAVAPPNGHDNDQNGKTRHTITDWTDYGILHNAGLRLLDDSLSINFPNRFTTEEAYGIWSVDTILNAYAISEMGLTSTEAAYVQAAYWAFDPSDLSQSGTEFIGNLADMVFEGSITQREADFMERWWDIMSQITSTSSFTVTQDSLDEWRDDILDITWQQSEQLILPFLSIAYYSFDFWLNEGMDDTHPLVDK